MQTMGVGCVFHYVPLHDSVMGRRCTRTATEMANTDDLSARLVRLPLWHGLSAHQAEVIHCVETALTRIAA